MKSNPQQYNIDKLCIIKAIRSNTGINIQRSVIKWCLCLYIDCINKSMTNNYLNRNNERVGKYKLSMI